MEKFFLLAYIGGMGMEAFGVYLATLRDGRKITQQDLAERLGVSERIVRNWEKGEHEPRVGVFASLIEAIQGGWSDVARVLANGVTEEEARRIAQARLNQPATIDDDEEIVRRFSRLSPRQKQAFLDFLRASLQDE